MNISKLQERYKEYAFMSGNGEDEGRDDEGGLEAMTKWSRLRARTFEGGKWYFITFKPFDDAYTKDPEWFQVKGLDSCRQKVKNCLAALFTREIEATKTHINGLCYSLHDLHSVLHNKTHARKYKIFCTVLSTRCDMLRVLDYITKEEEHRTFVKYLDYIMVPSNLYL